MCKTSIFNSPATVLRTYSALSASIRRTMSSKKSTICGGCVTSSPVAACSGLDKVLLYDLLGESVGGFGDALELRFTLEVQEDGGFFYETALENALDDFIAVQRLVGFTQDFADDIGDSSLLVTPFFESINTTADKHEALIFDQLVVDGLGGNVLALEIAVLDGGGNFVEVHVLAVFLEDDVNLVTNILRIDHRPFDKAPTAVQSSQVLGSAGQGGGLLRVGYISGFGDVRDGLRLADLLDSFDQAGYTGLEGFFVIN